MVFMNEPKKVVYIANATIPSYTASSIQVMKMCHAMVQRGYEVQLFAPQRRVRPDLRSVDLWYHYGVQPQFSIRWLPWIGRTGGQTYGLLAVFEALRSKADIIYSRHLPSAAMAAMITTPVICELHDMPGGYTGPTYLHLFMHVKAPRNRVVVISNALKQDLLSTYPHWMDGRRVVVGPDGVDVERFADLPDCQTARRTLGLREDGYFAGYAGHLYPGKGVEIILGLAARCPTINFFLMGGQPDAVSALRGELERKGINNIRLWGFVPNTELPLYLAACDVLLLPNQRTVSGSGGGDIARWTSPMKLFEYMACGRLIIASDLPVLREVLNEENALLCDPEDLDAWQQGLERAATDLAWRRTLGEHARSEARRYAWTRRVDVCLQPVVQNLISLDS